MKLKSLIILSLMFVFLSVSFADAPKPDKDIYGIFSEFFSGTNIYNTGDDAGSDENAAKMYFWNQQLGAQTLSDDVVEGKKFIRLKIETTEWDVMAITPIVGMDSVSPRNMENYFNGSIKFLVRASSTSLSFGTAMVGFQSIQDNGSGNSPDTLFFLTLDDLGFTANGKWQEVVIPLNSTTTVTKRVNRVAQDGTVWDHIDTADVTISENFLSKVNALFIFQPTTLTVDDKIDIDNIRWEKANAGPTGVMSLKMFDVETNEELSPDSNFSFDFNKDVDSGWKVAKEYIKIDLNLVFDKTNQRYKPYNIKIYTDNKNESANPKYTGTDSNPAGLINVDNTDVKKNMCWRVSSSIIDKSNLKIYQHGDYLSDKEDEGNCYLWMQDLSKQNPAFDNIYSYIWNNVLTPNPEGIDCRGAQFSEYSFGAPAFPLYLYLGANFSDTVVGENYSTNTLTIELIYDE